MTVQAGLYCTWLEIPKTGFSHVVAHTINEPLPEKTNNVVSEQVQHKLGCTVTEARNFRFRKKRNCTI